MGAGDVWEKTGASTWTKRATLAAAAAGQAEAWYSGAGLPSAGLGVDGDWYLDTTSGPIPPTYVTSLPGSPYDGQVVYYQSAAMATLGVVWQLRYRATASGSYKWEFIGGSPLNDFIFTSEATSSATYVDLATVGPSVTIPLAGDYEWSWGALIQVSAAAFSDAGIAVMNPSNATFSHEVYFGSGTANEGSSVASTRVLTVTATGTYKLRYLSGAANARNFMRRFLRATPIRVG